MAAAVPRGGAAAAWWRAVLLAAAVLLSLAAAGRAEETGSGVERERLFAALLAAPTEAEGRAAEDAVWRFWMAQGPTADIRRDVDAAMSARSRYDFARALELLDGVVARAPDYAEGWNQRAFIHFLRQDYDESLADIDRALALEPKHFAALSGRALILMGQGRMGLGQKALREAVAIHPWLKERSMLIPLPGEPVIPPGGKGI